MTLSIGSVLAQSIDAGLICSFDVEQGSECLFRRGSIGQKRKLLVFVFYAERIVELLNLSVGQFNFAGKIGKPEANVADRAFDFLELRLRWSEIIGIEELELDRGQLRSLFPY